MPPWESYKADAKARGYLAFEFFVVMSTPAKSLEDVKANLPAHLEYQGQLERAGKLAFAGPMSDETGEHMQGIGLIIYRAASFDAARSLADADPMHKSGARSLVLRKWMINEGSLSVSVGLSTRTVALG
jgi:uncharacterized protein YciI